MHTSQPTATLRRTGGRLAKASPIKSISISVIQKKPRAGFEPAHYVEPYGATCKA